jgi:phosphate-selective porin
LEFAGRYGPFVLQSEVLFQEVVDNDNVSHQLGGYYTSLLWNIMGKSRRYKNGEVEFVESKTHGLELALRYSMADVEAHRDGDVGEVVSIALNYYARNALRLSLQYERAELTTFNPKDWDTYVKGDSISARLQLML